MTSVPCRVCNKLYDGTTHCSVDACKACSMFFKRSELWVTMPECKDGNNKCKLDRVGKITCSACRYQKCIEAGLRSKRNNKRLQSKENQEVSNNHSLENFIAPLDIHRLAYEEMPTLKRVAYFYAQTSNDSRDNQYALLLADGAPVMELPGNRFVGRYTQSISNRTMSYDISQFAKLINGAFPAFTTIDNSFQNTLFYSVMFPLFELSASFRSLRVFNDVNCRKVLYSEALYVDLEDLSGFLDPNAFANPMDYKAVTDYISVWWRKYLNTSHKTMHRIKITDVEYLAVCALTIWDEVNFCHNPQLSQMAEKHRSLIYKDLDYYYKNILRLDNYVERIMNFKELSAISKSNYNTLSEGFYFLQTFNYYRNTEGLYDASSRVINAYETLKEQ